MTKFECLIFVAIAGIGVAIALPAVDQAGCVKSLAGKGIVVEKTYSPGGRSTGVGVSSHGKGSGPVIVSTYSPEKYVVIVSFEGETFSEEVDSNSWGAIKVQSQVDVFKKQGRFFNWGNSINAK